MSCVATMTLGAGEARVHQVTVVIPDDGRFANISGPCRRGTASAWCRRIRRWRSAGQAMSVAPLDHTAGRARQPYACHTFTIGKQVEEQCSEGFVMNAAGRCVCPEGTTFRNGQCSGGGTVTPTAAEAVHASARPDPDRRRALHLPARHRAKKRPLRQGRAAGMQCKLLPGQIRLENGRCVCPRGTSLIRGECRKDQPPQCKLLPGQIRLENGRCVCPRGTSLIRGECRKRQVECPKGQVLDRNGRCVTIQPQRCPRGTVGTPPNCRKLQLRPDQPGPAAAAAALRQPSNNNIKGQ